MLHVAVAGDVYEYEYEYEYEYGEYEYEILGVVTGN